MADCDSPQIKIGEKQFSNGDNNAYIKTHIIRFCLNYLTRFGIAGVVVYVCWIAIEHYHYWFSWHVILCTFGYLPLMAESLLLFLPDEIWSRELSRTAKYTIHGIIVLIGTLMLTGGNAVVFHYFEPGYHFNTAHGITGLISMIFVIISIPVGLAIKYHKEVKSRVPGRLIVWKLTHNTLGLLGYIIGIISLCYGYYTHWFVYYTSYESRLLGFIVTVIATLWTLNGALVSLYNQIKSVAS
ncbi:hypothetical protein GWI33_019130 [Rhynchophorus ferrugineus]|uniref:ascorbate ferrireductase (transmembrane) n=1 Tax=Rhynchophorus ferrugineus TaxID=354439 RepID=A0A834HTD2_RHYFE|nr:hypothetical protein GWI33_019130 [Rhynchophorus ferrugineus]